MLLAACGGGGGSSAIVAPPGPTPTPNPRLVGLADGASTSYDRTDEATVTVTTVGGGVPIIPAPNPSPTTTIVVSAYRDTVTVTGNQSFGGASGLYDVRTSTVPTGTSGFPYTSYSNVVDTYEGLIATAAGFDLVSYGSVSKQSSTTSFVSTDTFSSTATSTNTVPLRLVQVPAGAPFDPVLAYSVTSTSQSASTLPPGTNSTGPTSTTGSGTIALGADGALHAGSVLTGNDGSSSSSDETIAGPGLAGTMVNSASSPRFGKSGTTITTGPPTAAGGGYTVAFAVTYTGSGAPQPVATTVPLWYPDGPAQRPLAVHVTPLGAQSVPAKCALPSGLPAGGQATETVTTTVVPFYGAVSRIDETRWDAPNVGTLCSIASETYTQYDPATGAKSGSSILTTTRALRAATVPAAWRRRASASGAVPFVLPPAQARLPQLVTTLARHARATGKRT